MSDFDSSNLELPRTAVDIGCGAGNDIGELLDRNFKVFASDREHIAINIVKNKFKEYYDSQLFLEAVPMEKYEIPKSSIINSSFSLPFCNHKHFEILWKKINTSLAVGGIFSGQLFGKEHTWTKTRPNLTFHTSSDIKNLFNNFDYIFYDESNNIGKTSLGEEVRWHVFNIVALKIK